MKETHVVQKIYLPDEDSSKRKPSKKDFKNFDIKDEAINYIRSILSPYKIEVDVEKEIASKGRVGGAIEGKKGEYHNYCVTMDSGYMAGDIVKSLKSGEIELKTMGHQNISYQGKTEKIKEEVIKEFERSLKRWKEDAESLPDNYFSLKKFYEPIKIGRHIGDFSHYCWDCGKDLDLILIDDKTLALSDKRNYWDLTDNMSIKERLNYKMKLEDIKPCPVPDVTNGIKTSINVPTGDLIFSNHFGKVDSLYELEGEKYHSINGLLGRIKLAEDLAKRDVGYGQMGNMSIDVYLRNDGKEIIIGQEYFIDKKGKEKLRKFDGFKRLGSISLSVWRWQCADRKILEDKEYPLPELKKNGETSHDYLDWILAEVVPGKWNIEHYFDVSDCTDGIFSRLYLSEFNDHLTDYQISFYKLDQSI